MEDASSTTGGDVLPPDRQSHSQDHKYCMDCGKTILRRAEICPNCGCRQLPAVSVPPAQMYQPVNTVVVVRQSEGLQGDSVGKLILLLILNFFWNGLGNIAIGDSRGWGYGFLNWIFLVLSFFTFWVPCLLFFAYCGYTGYQFLLTQQSQSVPSSNQKRLS
jgi:hypothetical protein